MNETKPSLLFRFIKGAPDKLDNPLESPSGQWMRKSIMAEMRIGPSTPNSRAKLR